MAHLCRLILVVLLISIPSIAFAATPDTQPAEGGKIKVAVFPLGGGATVSAKEKVGFSIRSKLDRTGLYVVIDGPMMADLAGQLPSTPDAKTSPQSLQKVTSFEGAQLILWGTMDSTGANKATLQIFIWDTREPSPPQTLHLNINAPTDLRFISEKIVESCPGVPAFEHPSENAISRDPLAEKLWQANPNLLTNGDFSAAGSWTGLYMSEMYPLEIADQLPEVDKMCIVPLTLLEPGTSPLPADISPSPASSGQTSREGTSPLSHQEEAASPTSRAGPQQILAMNLSLTAAENNGLACLSDAIQIQPNTRYRLQFRYRSDGPKLHVFVKGYTLAKDAAGNPAMREVYRRQVPPTEATNGQWVTIDCDLNPQHVTFPVQELRVDLYAYLHPGMVYFDDVVLKQVGQQTHTAHDEALDKPTPRPEPTTPPSPTSPPDARP